MTSLHDTDKRFRVPVAVSVGWWQDSRTEFTNCDARKQERMRRRLLSRLMTLATLPMAGLWFPFSASKSWETVLVVLFVCFYTEDNLVTNFTQANDEAT